MWTIGFPHFTASPDNTIVMPKTQPGSDKHECLSNGFDSTRVESTTYQNGRRVVNPFGHSFWSISTDWLETPSGLY